MKPSCHLLLFVIGTFFLSCEKDATITSKDYPYVLTGEVTVSSDGALFQAQVLNAPKHRILDYGFVFFMKGESEKGIKIQLKGNELKKDEYTFKLNRGLRAEVDYLVRAFVQTDHYEVFGSIVAFKSQGSLSPIIHGFSPNSGGKGTKVEISGENFASFKSENVVRFGDFQAILDSVSENKLFVRVPQINEAGNVYVSVESAGMKASSENKFDLMFPWDRKATIPAPYAFSPSSFSIGNKIYLVGGILSGMGVMLNDFWEYDIQTDKWTKKSDFPGDARNYGVAFSLNGKGYYGMGEIIKDNRRVYANDIWEYDPGNDLWTFVSEFPGTLVQHAKSFVIDNKAYFGPGLYWSNSWVYFSDDLWQFDPIAENRWERKSSFPGSIRHVGFAMGTENRGYMGSGGHGWPKKDFYEYNPETDTWSLAGYYPGRAFYNLASFYLNGKLYIGLGSDNKDHIADMWEYNTETGKWFELQHCPVGTTPQISLSVNNKGYTGGGYHYEYNTPRLYNDINGRLFYEFNPLKN